jgi:metallopeptidase MepB
VKVEFGEAIGTMLEQWVWNPEVLRSMSRHYTSLDTKYEKAWLDTHSNADLPPEKLPNHVLENLDQMRRKSQLALHLQQLSESMFDLAVHHLQEGKFLEELDDTKLDTMYDALQCKYLSVSRPDLGYMHTSFNHLMSGMEAGYYAYLW